MPDPGTKAKPLNKVEDPEKKELTTAELREKMLADRKARILASKNQPVEEENTDPNTTPLETEEVEEEVIDPASSEITTIKKVKPVDIKGYIYDDKFNRYKKIEKVWEHTGIKDEKIWSENKDGVRDKYDNFEEYRIAAEKWRKEHSETKIIKEQRKEIEKVKVDTYPKLANLYSYKYDWGKLFNIFKREKLLSRSPYLKIEGAKGQVIRSQYDLEKVFMSYINNSHPEMKEKMLKNPDSEYHTKEFEKLRSKFWIMLKEKYPPLKKILTKPAYRPVSKSSKKKSMTDFEVVSEEIMKS